MTHKVIVAISTGILPLLKLSRHNCLPKSPFVPKAGHDREIRGNQEIDGDKLTVCSPESIEEEEAFEVYREQQYATVARRGRDTEGGTGGRGARNNLRRMVS